MLSLGCLWFQDKTASHMILKPIGVIALLDEACMFPKSIHDTFANKLFQNLHAHPRLGKAKFSETNFTISHYAGKVNYQTDSFLEKNRDYVVIDHCNLMSSSKCTFIAALFPTLPEESSRSYKFSSMASRFKIEKLKQFLPLTQQPATQGFIEYTHVVVPSSSAAGYLKDEHVSPDTVCHYGSDNTDSETVLQLRLPCGDHSKKEEVR